MIKVTYKILKKIIINVEVFQLEVVIAEFVDIMHNYEQLYEPNINLPLEEVNLIPVLLSKQAKLFLSLNTM